jgi:adenylate kinase family enzyme
VERVVVYGTSGSGKSTYAAALGLPHIELDAHRSADRGAFEHAIAGPTWVVEGVQRDEISAALERADTFVWLDPPRRVVVWRLLRRRSPVRFIAKTVRKHEYRRVHARAFVDAAVSRGIEVIHRSS